MKYLYATNFMFSDLTVKFESECADKKSPVRIDV